MFGSIMSPVAARLRADALRVNSKAPATAEMPPDTFTSASSSGA
jgi:hypothetical protein